MDFKLFPRDINRCEASASPGVRVATQRVPQPQSCTEIIAEKEDCSQGSNSAVLWLHITKFSVAALHRGARCLGKPGVLIRALHKLCLEEKPLNYWKVYIRFIKY